MTDNQMNVNEALEILKKDGMCIRNIYHNGKTYTVVVGNTGKNMNQDKHFEARSLENVVTKVQKWYAKQ